MNELKYNEEFPYAVVSLGEVKAYARYRDEAGVFASHYHKGEVIDTTPKPEFEEGFYQYSESGLYWTNGEKWWDVTKGYEATDYPEHLPAGDLVRLIRKESK